jgi:hypothetical protein
MGNVIEFRTGKPEANTLPSDVQIYNAVQKLARDINIPTSLHTDFCLEVTASIFIFASEQTKTKRKHKPKKKKKHKQ